MPLFFLGGAHGTGKSSVATVLGARMSVKVLSASRLIREEGVEPSTSDKRVGDIHGNQERLLRALARHRALHERILLDGHFCLRSSTGDAVAIPLEIFRRIAPDALLLLVDEPEEIAKRLEQRDGISYQLADVTCLGNCEHEAALLVSNELRIPLHVVRAPASIDETCEFLGSATD